MSNSPLLPLPRPAPDPTPTAPDTYVMELDLNVLNHLGLNLYSNVAAVVSEVVANSWDADATTVDIHIDVAADCVRIIDNGIGMTRDDINKRYLTVGYERRKDPTVAPSALGRQPMGRKGIGKLSLFSIASVVDIYTTKFGLSNALRLAIADIEAAMRSGARYHPIPLNDHKFAPTQGTAIVLSQLKSRLTNTQSSLRWRLARRFSIIGPASNFTVRINNSELSPADRDYFHKLQNIWYYGDVSRKYVDYCEPDIHAEKRDGTIDQASQVSGWLGTAFEPRQLRDVDGESLNAITILVHGKLAQEDILESINDGGLYTKYLIGEVQADFLDQTDKPDIATSNRQQIIEDDPRYLALRAFLRRELRHIANRWDELRNAEGVQRALEIPAINAWYKSLTRDDEARAKTWLGRVNRIPVERPEDRRRLLSHAVLAFESCRLKNNLDALNRISVEDIEAISDVFLQLDDIEAALYYQIIHERISVIKTLETKVDENAREAVVQSHVFNHLWLLDPSWERATESGYIERQMNRAFEDIEASLTDEERQARFDIKYRLTTGKHVIVELKRANRIVSTNEIDQQVRKYRSALLKLLAAAGRDNEPYEIVVIVGRELRDWAEPGGRSISEQQLNALGARVVLYQQLLDNAYAAYSAYLEQNSVAGTLFQLVQTIEEQVSAMEQS